MNRQRSSVEHHRQLDHNVADEADDRVGDTDLVAEAPLQELWHGGNFGLEVVRQEELAVQHQRDGRDPLEAGDRQADLIAAAGHADKMMGGNVRRDHRAADNPPGEIAAS